MPDVSLQKGSNTEVRISLELDMNIIQRSVLNVGLEELAQYVLWGANFFM